MKVFECYKHCLENAWMRLSIAPLFRSRRDVSNGGLLLSVAYDLTCFKRFFEGYKRCLENAWMRLWISPCFRSRRAVSNGGSHLSVSYDLTCFVRFFEIVQTLFEKCINQAVDSTIFQISSSCVEWWSSFVCSLRFDLFHDVVWTL